MHKVMSWSDDIANDALSLLYRYPETSMFLLSNYRECGFSLGDSIYSGNYKCIQNDVGNVVAVFCQTKNGHILLQTDRQMDYSSIIIESCLEENIAVAGCTGAWELVEPLWQCIQARFDKVITDFYSKDFLYSLDLDVLSIDNHAIRLLTKDDFDQWEPLNTAYFAELNFSAQATMSERKEVFESKVLQHHWWGYFDNDVLVAIAAFNACVDSIAQIGGVYVLPTYRRKGYAHALMSSLISDAQHIHGINKLILFTEPDNYAAQNLYQQIGFKRTGDYGLIFGSVR